MRKVRTLAAVGPKVRTFDLIISEHVAFIEGTDDVIVDVGARLYLDRKVQDEIHISPTLGIIVIDQEPSCIESGRTKSLDDFGLFRGVNLHGVQIFKSALMLWGYYGNRTCAQP